ncbi:MAG: PadR family transcriptional regulator [Kiritimatiellae bacterium]|nr:PadR family transcriptional regulator [Kiritimatiellia bacterium]
MGTETSISQWRRGVIEYCLLIFLSRGENYGYEIVQALRSIEALAVSESTVYPILSRLRADRMLKVRDVPSDSGPPRRYFSLTPAGRERLAEMEAYWITLSDAVNQLKKSKGALK